MINNSFANNSDKLVQEIYGTDNQQKFSYHHPSYIIFGYHDAKLQFSFKYSLSRKQPIYFGYSQLNIWNIYKTSQPFRDINFGPEIFYRLIDSGEKSLSTLDMGYIHLSNGKDHLDSRSLDRVYLRSNFSEKFRRHYINLNLMVYKIFNPDAPNNDIEKHLGFWEMTALFSDLLVFTTSSISLEYRVYAGARGYDFDQGANQVGLIWDFKSENISPSIYFQFFSGFSESLITYNQKSEQYRLGLMLTF